LPGPYRFDFGSLEDLSGLVGLLQEVLVPGFSIRGNDFGALHAIPELMIRYCPARNSTAALTACSELASSGANNMSG
jgi:hypothetical protein